MTYYMIRSKDSERKFLRVRGMDWIWEEDPTDGTFFREENDAVRYADVCEPIDREFEIIPVWLEGAQ